jgi:hypothetical protein
MSTPAFTLPALYSDMPASVYHQDPVPGGSLSSTGARQLLSPGCPKKFHYWRTRTPPPNKEFDFGSAAHKVLLGEGDELEIISADNYKGGKARADRDAAYLAGRIPVLERQMDVVEDMVAALYEHPIAAQLFEPGTGVAEQSLFWVDGPSGVTCRARLDYLSTKTTTDGKLIIPDYKTANSAAPAKIVKAIDDHGYHQQGGWYIDAVIGCGLAEDAVFLLVFQEKEPPYIVTVAELHPINGLWVGRELNDKARQVYAKCVAEDYWPAYADDIVTAELPPWSMRKMEDIIGAHPITGVRS